jgi:hypothetical protein
MFSYSILKVVNGSADKKQEIEFQKLAVESPVSKSTNDSFPSCVYHSGGFFIGLQDKTTLVCSTALSGDISSCGS